MHAAEYRIGIDIGSTTAKAAVFDSAHAMVYNSYMRHHGQIKAILENITSDIISEIGDSAVTAAITGSAGMGIAEQHGITFIQELAASADYADIFHPKLKTLVDIGGEDSKVIFFDNKGRHDLRMNGSCAGGTGAFIDQMVSLMNVSHEEFNSLAQNHQTIYPIASRCGVFAKTDVHNLLSKEIPKADIAASVFYALALQIKNTLMRGLKIKPKIAFAGGPLTFFQELQKMFLRVFELEESDIERIPYQALLPACGAAVSNSITPPIMLLSEFAEKLKAPAEKIYESARLAPIFSDASEYHHWLEKKNSYKAAKTDISSLAGKNAFLGIDSGSTTTKIVLTDEDGKIAFQYYRNNNSNPIQAVVQGINQLRETAAALGVDIVIRASAVTGYGEQLIKKALNPDYGIIETIAHFNAARRFDPNVTFILDIGGQDMKAIFIKNGIIENIEINEACSSGCGSFIESFSHSLDYSVQKFAEIACTAANPYDLGSRCTVFMNSKVKQSFREGAAIEDISAGLAYSIINNCLNKVLKIHDKSIFGDNIIVQGGTFRNNAVRKAFENMIGKSVLCPDISELMGAYGAALYAAECSRNSPTGKAVRLAEISTETDYSTKQIKCRACDNNCCVSKLSFSNGNVFYTGNRCENFFSDVNKKSKGDNLVKIKYDILFNRNLKPPNPKMIIGIPRVLNIYENFPFWAALFTECGIEVVLSDKSSCSLADSGAGHIMSDNICYPAKLVHGHITNLLAKKPDRVFYPMVTFEKDEIKGATNCFNCPIVSGYPDVISRGMMKDETIPIDTLNISFKDEKLLFKACFSYLKNFGLDKKTVAAALKTALDVYSATKMKIQSIADELIKKAVKNKKIIIVLAGRPYHIDPQINHGIPEIAASLGACVITEDSLPMQDLPLENVNVLSQWNYPNRIFNAVQWCRNNPNAELIQLNSFGCGPDTIVTDEVKELLRLYNKSYTLIRIDDLSSPGSLMLRVRSLIESIRNRNIEANDTKPRKRKTTKPFSRVDRSRTILAPFFSHFHSAYITAPFESMGLKCEILPPSDYDSVRLGLKYVNNEICYPATIVIGDILKALLSGRYNPAEIAVAITQTGGQCRASNYLSLLKKALVSTGFEKVPVVSVSLAKQKLKLNEQPGFKLNKIKFTRQAILGVLFGDCIAQMYHAIAPREACRGDAFRLVIKYNEKAKAPVRNNNLKEMLLLLRSAVIDFNNVQTAISDVPKIGVVGEVFVKNNPYGNLNIIDQLTQQRFELIMPPLINMFIQWFVNVNVKQELFMDRKAVARIVTGLLEKYFNGILAEYNIIMENFRFGNSHPNIHELADYARPHIDMAHHYFGEGWMIPGDIAYFYKQGVKDVLCLQPFGCLANHIVARGTEKQLRAAYPELNILYLDIDFGASEANVYNRLHLLTKSAKMNFAHSSNVTPREETLSL